MTKILMSIKPEFVDKILRGEKLYEFRRVIWKDWKYSKLNGIRRIIVYASAPVSAVVFEFEMSIVCEADICSLWKHFGDKSGTTEGRFFSYFDGKDYGYAIGVGEIWHHKEPIKLSDYGIGRPPQNFMYFKGL